MHNSVMETAHTDQAGNSPAAPSYDRVSREAYFPLVDVLRGLAAVSVLTLHVIYHANWVSFPLQGPLSWLRHGNQGVDLFFVISGFVVLYNAFGILDKYNGSFRGVFLLRRLARIVPLYYVTIAFYLCFVDDNHVLAARDELRQIISHLLFFHTYSADTFGSIDGVNWTIAIEMHFYLLILLLAPWLAKAKPSLLIAIALPVALAWRYYCFTQVDPADPWRNYHLITHSAQLPGRIDEFAFGMVLAIFLRKFPPTCIRWRTVWIFVLLLFSVLFLYTADSRLLNAIPQGARFALVNTQLGIAFSALVLAACMITSTTVVTLAAPLRYLGKISYGIYLWHLPVIMLLKGHHLEPLSFYAFTLVGAISLATLSWYLFEHPIIKVARRWETKIFAPAKSSIIENATPA